MIITIRDVPADINSKIDRLAASAGKSKQTYLLEQIRLIALYPELKEQESQYDSLVKKMGEILQQNTLVLKQVLEIVEKERNR